MTAPAVALSLLMLRPRHTRLLAIGLLLPVGPDAINCAGMRHADAGYAIAPIRSHCGIFRSRPPP